MTSDPRIPCGTSNPLAKAELRRYLLAVRRGLDADTRAAWDGIIGAQVVAWWRAQRPAALGVYWPLRDEPQLQAAYAALAQLGARLLLPVVVEKDAALEFADWRIGEAMVKDGMGVAVPAALRLQPSPPALLIPCLGYNKPGYRIGYGGGYYDRTLARAPRPQTVGVAYRCLEVDFDSDTHDVALDVVLTEAV